MFKKNKKIMKTKPNIWALYGTGQGEFVLANRYFLINVNKEFLLNNKDDYVTKKIKKIIQMYNNKENKELSLDDYSNAYLKSYYNTKDNTISTVKNEQYEKKTINTLLLIGDIKEKAQSNVKKQGFLIGSFNDLYDFNDEFWRMRKKRFYIPKKLLPENKDNLIFYYNNQRKSLNIIQNKDQSFIIYIK